jgi:hypothetical protein
VFDLSAFPVIELGVLEEIEQNPLSPVSPVSVDAKESSAPQPEILHATTPEPLDEYTSPDLSEQLHATLIRLVQRYRSLSLLAVRCSFDVYIEIKSDKEAESLTQSLKPWVSAPPSETEQNSPYADDVTGCRGTKVAIHSVRFPNISFDRWVKLFPLPAESDVESTSSALFSRPVE